MSDERKRDKLKRISSSWAGRTLASGRVAVRLGSAAGRRALRATSEASDAHLGTALADDLNAMKGLAMKVGQMASYLEGSMPPEAQRVLRTLQQGGEPLALEALQPGSVEHLLHYFEIANAGWGFTTKHYAMVAEKRR